MDPTNCLVELYPALSIHFMQSLSKLGPCNAWSKHHLGDLGQWPGVLWPSPRWTLERCPCPTFTSQQVRCWWNHCMVPSQTWLACWGGISDELPKAGMMVCSALTILESVEPFVPFCSFFFLFEDLNDRQFLGKPTQKPWQKTKPATGKIQYN